jgi:dipeptidyl-peptidase-4
MRYRIRIIPILFFFIFPVFAQQTDPSLLTVESLVTYRGKSLGPVQWQANGSGYLALEPSPAKKNFVDIVRYDVNTGERTVKVPAEKLIPSGATDPLSVEDFATSADEQKLLIFTNSERVWRSNTRGDYWVLDLQANSLRKLGGADAKPSTLMFAKFLRTGSASAMFVRTTSTSRVSTVVPGSPGSQPTARATSSTARSIGFMKKSCSAAMDFAGVLTVNRLLTGSSIPKASRKCCC